MNKSELSEKAASLGYQIHKYDGFAVTGDDGSVIHCSSFDEINEYLDDCQLSETELTAKYLPIALIEGETKPRYGFITDREIGA